MKTKFAFVVLAVALVFSSKKTIAQYGCGSAVAISSGYTVTNQTSNGTNNWITSATVGSCSPSSSYYTTGDAYVYSFTTGTNAAGYKLNAKVTADLSYMVAGIYSTCSGTSISGCIDSDYNISTVPEGLLLGDCGLSANTTYYLVISRNASSAGSGNLQFDIDYFTLAEIDGNEAADECASATLIDFSTTYSGITAACYTPSAQSHCWGSLDNDSWIEFTASATTVEIDYDLNNCSNPSNGIQFAIYSSCGGSDIDCEGGVTGSGTYSVSGLTVGVDYLLRIDGWAGNVCEFNLDPSSGIATTPDNDVCGDAIELTCGSDVIGSNILANATGAPTGCTDGGTPSKGVWYTFTGTGQNITLSTNNAGTNFNTELNIYTGTCGAFTCVGGASSGTATEYTFYAVNTTLYTIYVDGDGAAEGQFQLTLACANCDANAGSWD